MQNNGRIPIYPPFIQNNGRIPIYPPFIRIPIYTKGVPEYQQIIFIDQTHARKNCLEYYRVRSLPCRSLGCFSFLADHQSLSRRPPDLFSLSFRVHRSSRSSSLATRSFTSSLTAVFRRVF